MNSKVTLEFPYVIQARILKSKRHSRPYYPVLSAVIEIPGTKNTSAPFSEKFLVDSGASISILHQRNKELVDNISPVDYVEINFGNSSTRLPVYNVTLRILGKEFAIIAALANDLRIGYSLLGYHGGIENFDIFVMNNRKRVFKLIHGL